MITSGSIVTLPYPGLSGSNAAEGYGMSKKYESAQFTDMEGHHPEGYDQHRGDFLDMP
jgi:hypothetical protein